MKEKKCIMKTDKELVEFASKKYGQNFLKDHIYIDKIIQSMSNDNLPIVEIGPGLGDLTKELVRVRNVTAFEVDNRLCKHLTSQFSEHLQDGSFRLICEDVMQHWKENRLLDTKYHLVANLPYYIATNLILKALHDTNCQSILVMVQKEVAQKFAAKPKQRDFSALGVLASSVGEANLLFEVDAKAFIPAPKVTSAVLSIRKIDTLDDVGFENFLKCAFTQPRKKLSKNLSIKYDKNKIVQTLDALDMPQMVRPHEATTEQYHQIYIAIDKRKI